MESLGWVDYALFLLLLLASVGVGLFYAVKSRYKCKETADDLLVGGHKMPLLPVALSLLVSFQSAIIVLGCSSEMYMRGTTFWWHIVGISFSAIATCILFVPVFYYLRLISVYEYLEARFDSKGVRKVGAVLYILVTLMYLSIALYAPALALSSVSNLKLWMIILLAGCVCTAYVVLGGIKAVVWTDALQAVFMLIALVAVAIKGTLYAGGFAKVWNANVQGGRIIFFDGRTSPLVYMSTWGVIVGQFFSWLGWYGINQSAVQRYCSMRTVNQGQAALLLNIPALFVVVTLICYCGLVMYASFQHCDPLTAGVVSDRDMLLPYFVMEMLGSIPGIPGLFIGCLFSGTLSTVSSGLNSMSAVVWEDLMKRSSSPPTNPVVTIKCLCLMFGVLTTCLAFLAPFLGGVLQGALSTMGAINGPLTGIFLLGVLVPFANKTGAISGSCVAFVVLVTLCFGAHIYQPFQHADLALDVSQCVNGTNMTFAPVTPEINAVPSFFSISVVLYDMLGIFIVIFVAIPVSILTGGRRQKVNPLLFHPVIRKWLPTPEKKDRELDIRKPFIPVSS